MARLAMVCFKLLGPKHESALPGFVEALKENYTRARKRVVLALKKIDPQAAKEAGTP